MNLVDATGHIVPEPDWSSIFSDELEIGAAHEHWRVVTTEMRERGILAPSNAHALRRLVVGYIVYERAELYVTEHGPVTKPRRGNSKAIARVSPYLAAMEQVFASVTMLEAKLGLLPRDRSSATKAERTAKRARAADQYLKPVSR